MFLKKIESNQQHSYEKLSPSLHISCIIHHCLYLKRSFKYSCQLLYKQLSEDAKVIQQALQPIRYQHMKSGVTTTAFVYCSPTSFISRKHHYDFWVYWTQTIWDGMTKFHFSSYIFEPPAHLKFSLNPCHYSFQRELLSSLGTVCLVQIWT